MSALMMNAAFSVAFLPVTINFAIEVTFPVMPGLITASMMIALQFTSFLVASFYNSIM